MRRQVLAGDFTEWPTENRPISRGLSAIGDLDLRRIGHGPGDQSHFVAKGSLRVFGWRTVHCHIANAESKQLPPERRRVNLFRKQSRQPTSESSIGVEVHVLRIALAAVKQAEVDAPL